MADSRSTSANTISDEEILTEFRYPEKREKAFTWLVKKYQQTIYWFVRRMVIDHEDANDLTQEVFIKVWENIENFRGDSKLIYWIYRIATNLTLSFLDKKKRKGWLSLDNEGSNLSNQFRVGNYLDADEVQLKLQKAILTLPEKQKVVFQLRYYDEVPYDEMSKMLGTSAGALKASYFHAVKKVEKSLKGE